MRINDIEQFFETHVPKKTLSELSLDSNNNITLINSQNESFDFDNIDTPLIQRDKIKTSDTVYFKDGKKSICTETNDTLNKFTQLSQQILPSKA